MSESVFIGSRASAYKSTPLNAKYNKVIIHIDDESDIEYGNGDNVLELTCPWGTMQMAQDILTSIGNFEYRPYDTDWVLLNPAAELGDGVTISGEYSGIYAYDTEFSKMMTAKISAPQRKEVLHEFTYKSPEVRETNRKFAAVRASLRVNAESIEAEVASRLSQAEEIYSTLSVHATDIAARVTQTGSNSNNSFSWQLTANGFILKSNGSEVFKATSGGVKVTGEIAATSGYIGDGITGFTITSNSIYNKKSSLDANSSGVYIGNDGISLGNNGFKVDSYGNLEANTGIFRGSVYANQIETGMQQGDIDAGYIQGSQIGQRTISGGNVGNGTLSTYNTDVGINTSLGYADFSNGVFNDFYTAVLIRAYQVRANSIIMNNTLFTPKQMLVQTPGGGVEYIRYIGY